MPKVNEAHWDRGIRLVLGVGLGALALVEAGGGWITIPSAVVAVVMFATAAAGFCPLYALLGRGTCPLER